MVEFDPYLDSQFDLWVRCWVGDAEQTAEQHLSGFEWVRVLVVEEQANFFDFRP